MKVTPKQYAISLYEAAQNKNDNEIKLILENFVCLLDANNDIFKADKIIEEFKEIWNEKERIAEAEIISSRELDKDIIELLNSYIAKLSGAKKITAVWKIDKNIIGGVIIKYKDKVLDGSLKTSLSELRNKMIK